MLKAVEENQYLSQLLPQKTRAFVEHCDDGWRGSINQLNERDTLWIDLYVIYETID